MMIITIALVLLFQGILIRAEAQNQDQDVMNTLQEYLGEITDEVRTLNEKYESLRAKSELSTKLQEANHNDLKKKITSIEWYVKSMMENSENNTQNHDLKKKNTSIEWYVKSMMETSENNTQNHEKMLEKILERLDGEELPNKTQSVCNTDIRLKNVDFSRIEGKAGATSFYGDCCTPYKGFAGPEWHSGESTVPQALWFHLDQPIKVVMYSFKSRPAHEVNLKADGPSKYEFFGSNGTDCSDQSSWVVLKKDHSGTPFTPEYQQRSEYVPNPDFYTCYGFKIIDVPGRFNGKKWSLMTNINWVMSYVPDNL